MSFARRMLCMKNHAIYTGVVFKKYIFSINAFKEVSIINTLFLNDNTVHDLELQPQFCFYLALSTTSTFVIKLTG